MSKLTTEESHFIERLYEIGREYGISCESFDVTDMWKSIETNHDISESTALNIQNMYCFDTKTGNKYFESCKIAEALFQIRIKKWRDNVNSDINSLKARLDEQLAKSREELNVTTAMERKSMHDDTIPLKDLDNITNRVRVYLKLWARVVKHKNTFTIKAKQEYLHHKFIFDKTLSDVTTWCEDTILDSVNNLAKETIKLEIYVARLEV